MMEWMLMPYRRYADFSGRSRRKEFWLFQLFYFLVLAVLMVIAFAGVDFPEPDAVTPPEAPNALAMTGFALLGLFMLGSIIPQLAVQVRRFHDQDKSGWMLLLNFIPYIGGLVVFVFMCLDGTRGDNSYGPDPKAENRNDIFA